MSAARAERPYVLGTGEDELARLGLQHRLWSDAAVAAWKRAGIGPGSRVLDFGCGPGFAALDLGELVTPAGRVVGVDESPSFIAHLHDQARARGLGHVSGVVRDVQRLAGSNLGEFDAAYARWVLCFVPDPESVIAGVASLLRRAGSIILHDYFAYTSMTAAPRGEWHDRLVRATAASFKSRGGDPDVMGRVPAMLIRHEFDVLHIDVHQRLARGGPPGERSAMMAWPGTWWRTYAPKLVAMGSMTQGECDESLRELAAIENDPARFIVCPPVYEIIAKKR